MANYDDFAAVSQSEHPAWMMYGRMDADGAFTDPIPMVGGSPGMASS